jgi:tetratricopeptide (TPR) repeat protein
MSFDNGIRLYNEKKHKEAIVAFKQEVDSNGESLKPIYNIGVCYIKLKEYEEAIPYLKKAIEINDLHVNATYNLAYCYAMLKNYKLSYVYYKRANALDLTCEDTKKALKLLENNHINIRRG